MVRPISVCFHQKMHNWYLGNYKKKKKKWRKIFTRFNRRCENQNVGSKWTLLMHWSVNLQERFLICRKVSQGCQHKPKPGKLDKKLWRGRFHSHIIGLWIFSVEVISLFIWTVIPPTAPIFITFVEWWKKI